MHQFMLACMHGEAGATPRRTMRGSGHARSMSLEVRASASAKNTSTGGGLKGIRVQRPVNTTNAAHTSALNADALLKHS